MSFRPTPERLWPTPPPLDALNAAHANTLGEATGMRFTDIGVDFLELSLPVDQRTKQPAGLLHGGASAALIETVGSVASHVIAGARGQTAVGTELSCSHLRSARDGWVRGTCRALRIGRSTHVWEVKVYDERARLICVGRLTTVVLGGSGQ